jgi:hypothetical protein
VIPQKKTGNAARGIRLRSSRSSRFSFADVKRYVVILTML